ncbi:MAG: hypothetical protein K6T65_09065 [Peptococcaceae bacterium]|nr:hypothetical protein [Peptococcaceae bacterium]
MLERIKAKIAGRIVCLMVKVRNERGELKTFATIAGLTFVSVMLIWVGYQILQTFFPDFLNSMLNQIKSKFTIS